MVLKLVILGYFLIWYLKKKFFYLRGLIKVYVDDDDFYIFVYKKEKISKL